MAKKIQVRAQKFPLVLNCIVGAIFVLIGIFVVIPTFGLFGIAWTLIAAVILVNGTYHLLKRGAATSEIYITDTEEPDGGPARPYKSLDTEERLTALRDLYDRRLITHGEYEAKRAEILKEL